MGTKEIKLWRYYLPSIKGDGWAEIVIASSGFFGAVSDYGDYAFAWRHTGCDDVRKFFLKAPAEWSYFAGKLGHPSESRQYDGAATLKGIKERILSSRRDLGLTKEEARTEWDLLEAHEELEHESNFSAWYQETSLGDAAEHRDTRVSPQLEHFCKVTMGRLVERIKAELSAEAKKKPRRVRRSKVAVAP